MTLETIIKKIGKNQYLTCQENDYLFKLRNTMVTSEQHHIINTIIVQGNIGFVKQVVSRYQNDPDYDDLIQEGCIYLMFAVSHYRMEKNTPFYHYATVVINNGIKQYRMKKKRLIPLPYSVIRGLKVNSSVKQTKERCEIIIDQTTPMSLNQTITDELGVTMEWIEILADEVDIEEEILRMERKNIIRQCLSQLKERERNVVIERYGLYGGSPKSCRELGEKYHISERAVRKIEKRALEKLKNLSAIKNLFE